MESCNIQQCNKCNAETRSCWLCNIYIICVNGYAYWVSSNERVRGIIFCLPACLHRLILCSVCVSTANCDWVRNFGIKYALRLVHQKQRLESSDLWNTRKTKITTPISFLWREQSWTLLIFASVNIQWGRGTEQRVSSSCFEIKLRLYVTCKSYSV